MIVRVACHVCLGVAIVVVGCEKKGAPPAIPDAVQVTPSQTELATPPTATTENSPPPVPEKSLGSSGLLTVVRESLRMPLGPRAVDREPKPVASGAPILTWRAVLGPQETSARSVIFSPDGRK